MKKAMKKKRKKEKDVNLINKNKCMFLVCVPHTVQTSIMMKISFYNYYY